MRYLLTVFCWLLVSVTGLAQQTDNYRDLRAKMLYVKENIQAMPRPIIRLLPW